MANNGMTPKQYAKLAKKAGKLGGLARAKVLSPERRKEIGLKAIQTRWAKVRASSALGPISPELGPE